MATPTLQDISIRLSAVDGIGTAVPSQAAIPVIETDLNGLHTTLNQLVLTIQAQLNTLASQIAILEVGLAGEVEDQAVRVDNTVVVSGTLGGPYTINLPAPYADGNYNVQATISMNEPISTAGCYIGGVQQQSTPGNGVLVWVMNNDSVDHTVTINVFTRHD